MASKGKGKEVTGKDSGGKRKRGDGKYGGRKKGNPAVLQFFEDVADVDGYFSSDDSDFFDDDFFDVDFDTLTTVKSEPEKAQNSHLFPKEEGIAEEEFGRMMEERYKDASKFTYAEDSYETKRSVEKKSYVPTHNDPTIWKVKCMVGRERHSAFCLMHKYLELKSLGSKLQIISVFAVEHVKGYIFIEADKQGDVNEACKGFSSIYTSRVVKVQTNEVSHLLSVRRKYNEVSAGTWARVKNGKYKGDLAEVVAVNDERKRATVRLIPRIDLQAMAGKFGGGVAMKKGATPAPRLISSSDLEEFRPLIQRRCDRDTGLFVEVLDGLMLKDGFVYKKVSIASLNCWGVEPSDDELMKFKVSENEGPGDLEWLSQLYGDEKKKSPIRSDKGGGKGEGSSGSKTNNYEMHDLVCFGRKDFGIFIGMEKDDCYKILKEGTEGPIVVTLQQHELKNALHTKFSAIDKSMKTISINDSVRVLDGPCQDRQGIVKQIYRGTVFLHDENEAENGGYFCCKSTMCEKIKLSVDAYSGKDGGEIAVLGFEDFPSSPKSPLSPKRPWQANNDIKQGDKDGMFSIGQTLRIRLGPLKGYLCRVLAIRRSDVTVKLDSKHKIYTVKCEHLSEVRGKGSRLSESEDLGCSSLKPFDILGTEGCSSGWMTGVEKSADGNGWGAGGLSTERSSWPSCSTSGLPLQPETNSASLLGSVDNDLKKDGEDATWGRKIAMTQNSSWGNATANEKAVENSNQIGGWENSAVANANDNQMDATAGKNQLDPWCKGKNVEPGLWGKSQSSAGGAAASWGKAVQSHDKVSGGEDQVDSWGKPTEKLGIKDVSSGSMDVWKNSTPAPENQTVGWGKPSVSRPQPGADNTDEKSGWSTGGTANKDQTDNWNKSKSSHADGGSSWSKQQDGGSSWGKQQTGGSSSKQQDGGLSWGKQQGGDLSWGKKHDAGSSLSKQQDEGSPWGKQQEGGSSSDKQQDGGSSWGKQQDKGSTWGKKEDVGLTWGKQQEGGSSRDKKEDGGSSWGKERDGGSSWGKQEDGGSTRGKQQDEGSAWGKARDGGSSWGKQQEGGSSWGKQQGGGSSLSKQQDGDSPCGKQQDGGSSWGKQQDGVCSWNKQAGATDNGSSWKSNKASIEGDDSSLRSTGNQSDRTEPSGWSNRSAENVEEGKQGGGDGWSSGKISGGGSASGCGQTAGWKSGSSNVADGDSNWGKKGNWNSGSSDAGGGNQDSTWGKKSNWNSGGNQKSDWGKILGSGDAGGDQDSGGNWRGGYGGRGGSGRGGFRGRGGYGGRGRSDEGGFGDNGGTEGGGFRGRGSFGGRGRSDRGGFGGRGRERRDQTGDWNNRNETGQDNSDGYKRGGNDNGEGWKSNSWNQEGGDKGKWKSWNSGGGTSNQAGGSSGNQPASGRSSWNQPASGGSSWNQPASGGSSWNQPASGGSSWNQPASGRSSWNQPASGGSSGKQPASGGSSGKQPASGGSSWNQPASGGSSWNQPADAKPADSPSSDWNKGSSGGGNQSKDAKQGTNEGGELSSNSWGKAASSPWGKGNNGGGKGGW